MPAVGKQDPASRAVGSSRRHGIGERGIARSVLADDGSNAAPVVAQGYAAIARLARLVLLDLTGLSFCDARGLGAFVRIANRADAAGCGFGLIAPRRPVAKILRISGLDSRLPVFASIDDARALRTVIASV